MTDLTKFTGDQLQSTSLLADKFKMELHNAIDQLDKGYKDIGLMYKVLFYAGIVLIGVGIGFAFLNGKTLFTIIFSGMGAADILAFFLTKPIDKLQESREQYAKTALLCFNWFTDIYNWNSWILNKKDISFEEFEKVSDKIAGITEKTIFLINNKTVSNP
jgi:hypothetical protein